MTTKTAPEAFAPVRMFSASTVLAVWEQGAGQHPLDRALTILTAAYPEADWDRLAGLTLGERDQLLWELRDCLFGSQLDAISACPQCGEQVEFQLNVREAQTSLDPHRDEPHTWTDGTWTATFRLPTSRDLAAAAGQEREAAQQTLRTRTLLAAGRNGLPETRCELPDHLWPAIEGRMAELDVPGDVKLELSCPACSERWLEAFDIAQFLWDELAGLARRLLQEVDQLARAYGWSETDILNLSPARRRAYLQMATP